MATRAEVFKSEEQRAAQSRKQKAAPRRAGAAAGAVGTRTTPPKPQVPNPVSHNLSPRAGKDSVYELEVSATTRPSRKSTRRSPGHVKTDTSLRIKAMNKTSSPQARAARAKQA